MCELFNAKYPEIKIPQATFNKIVKLEEHGKVKDFLISGREYVLKDP